MDVAQLHTILCSQLSGLPLHLIVGFQLLPHFLLQRRPHRRVHHASDA